MRRLPSPGVRVLCVSQGGRTSPWLCPIEAHEYLYGLTIVEPHNIGSQVLRPRASPWLARVLLQKAASLESCKPSKRTALPYTDSSVVPQQMGGGKVGDPARL